ncbi:DUF2848 family protein [Paraburkholderia sp. MM5384-R2]|uniref:DUF2848 family protein n=1 Tax=Paraburkholderia sp. MM5384-R2 TaxID=2723097 RepID=UPI003906BAE9
MARLVKIGVPAFHRVPSARLTRTAAIDLPCKGNTGGVDFVLFQHGGEFYVSIGSDHTGNEVEANEVTIQLVARFRPLRTEELR